MEDNYKIAIQPQRRLNPNMKKVVKAKVVKPFDARIIYLTLDSSWVSPTHVVPKKRGMIVLKNEHNEKIPTRTVMEW